MTSTEFPSFKCVIVGDGGVGKTTLVLKHLTGEFTQIYDPTLGVEVHPLVFNTSNHRQVRFNVWDIAGQEKYSGLGAGYFVQADCAIIVFSLTSTISFHSVNKWKWDLEEVCGQIPMIVVGTKYDLAPRSVTQERISAHYGSHHGLTYYNVSSKTNYNIEKPFLTLTRQLLGTHTITFTH